MRVVGGSIMDEEWCLCSSRTIYFLRQKRSVTGVVVAVLGVAAVVVVAIVVEVIVAAPPPPPLDSGGHSETAIVTRRVHFTRLSGHKK